jgi:hypothetical protein
MSFKKKKIGSANDVSYIYAKYQAGILCIMSYTKITNMLI